MSEHFIVEANKITAGVAVRVPGGFRFFHSDPRFQRLDGEVFRKARTLARKVRELAQAFGRGSQPEGARTALV
ncbi:hypothetical protein [Novosphingobium album (ex Liu et al. 2023)]|uniref:Uncharacterized protein n=1 Tax=Novosphingobium album (ex Liu et al. 2023) TaxID=3031130 RepID=A0ABT5WTD0_9SPHN|nr:hypothetical protein [Novosphingobium album (ex Liu et al. 2023)]MDE8652783.1 hypothetical protein [Novosphingobium album (ex Liu et al. 2023)]